ncbi:MAG: SDR family NAD(P)-dependent oxidoreductase [Planctomycetes bacterium]|nr:SDR family NAD(P)-dependent oxidoreductase [Planctomycetota bacterium]
MATYLITGANRGIGLELARQLSARGDSVIGVCRDASAELDATGAQVHEGVDVTDDDFVARLAKTLAGRSIDVLINNAGVLSVETLGDMSFDRIRRQIEVNAISPLRVTTALLSTLHAGSKLIVITSRMGSIQDNGSGGYYGYRMSKAAVNAAFKSLANDLRSKRIAVGILHPGMVATEMTGGQGIDVRDSAANLLARIDALTLENTGVFQHANGEILSW